jgi:hypothetical protein
MKMKNGVNDHPNHLFVCDCGDLTHQFVISYFNDFFGDDLDDEFTYIHVHLTPHTFWKRLKIGIAYIFGKRSQFGAFEEIILNSEECQRLSLILEQRSRGVVPNA